MEINQMDKQMLSKINSAYCCLEMKQKELINALFYKTFKLESGWYNGHYDKDETGNWFLEYYPIPVISVKDICDIEISFDKISISTKLKQNTSLTYNFEKFIQYEFEAYGVDDYLADFYHSGKTIQYLKENIRASNENKIGFSFIFPFDTDGKQFYEFVQLLKQEGFYY